MYNYRICAEHFLYKGEWLKNQLVHIQDGKVAGVTDYNGESVEYTVHYLTNALIDNHIHGGDGLDTAKADQAALMDWLEQLARNGVGGIVLTLCGAANTIREGLKLVKAVMDLQKTGNCGGARLLGAHLEGPFISPKRPGAIPQDAFLVPDVRAYQQMVNGYEDVVKEITIAPELEGADALVGYLKQHNVRVLAGHSDCDYERAVEAFSVGVGAVCHTFNAIKPIGHRDPGIVTAALVDPDVYCEMICDLEHLHPSILQLILRCKGKERAMVISDAVVTTHLPDGEYQMYGHEVVVKNGVSRHKIHGCLDGGGCYIAKSVKNLTGIGVSFEDAVTAASVTPASWLGVNLDETAFLQGWDAEFTPKYTFIGKDIYGCDLCTD